MSDLVVPSWLTDPEAVGPCPCGNPPDDNTIIVNGADGLRRWFHEPCMSFLRYEMGEEQIQDMEEWRKRRHEAKDP